MLDNGISLSSRLAKKTPKKKDYFVAIYRKDNSNVNTPYLFKDFPDYFICNVIDDNKSVFCFS